VGYRFASFDANLSCIQPCFHGCMQGYFYRIWVSFQGDKTLLVEYRARLIECGVYTRVGNHPAAVNASSQATTLICRAPLIQYGVLSMEHRALLVEYRALLIEYGARMNVGKHSASVDAYCRATTVIHRPRLIPHGSFVVIELGDLFFKIWLVSLRIELF